MRILRSAFVFGKAAGLRMTDRRSSRWALLAAACIGTAREYPRAVSVHRTNRRDMYSTLPQPRSSGQLRRNALAAIARIYLYAGDMEMWLRFAAHGSVCAPNSLQAVYRMHEANMSFAYLICGISGSGSWLPTTLLKIAVICLITPTACTSVEARLSYAAVGNASSAFNDGQTELEQFSQIAVSLLPGVKRTLPWLKFAFKRGVGVKGMEGDPAHDWKDAAAGFKPDHALKYPGVPAARTEHCP